MKSKSSYSQYCNDIRDCKECGTTRPAKYLYIAEDKCNDGWCKNASKKPGVEVTGTGSGEADGRDEGVEGFGFLSKRRGRKGKRPPLSKG